MWYVQVQSVELDVVQPTTDALPLVLVRVTIHSARMPPFGQAEPKVRFSLMPVKPPVALPEYVKASVSEPWFLLHAPLHWTDPPQLPHPAP